MSHQAAEVLPVATGSAVDRGKARPPRGSPEDSGDGRPPLSAGEKSGRGVVEKQPWVQVAAVVGQRLAFGALVLAAITFLTYLGLEMARGTNLQPATGTAIDSTWTYLGRLLRGDLGLTAAGSITLKPVPVLEVLGSFVIRSLGLLAFSLLLATGVGVPLGLIAANKRHSRWSLTVILASIVGISIPSFFAALVLQLLMIRWAQATGSPLLPIGGFGWDAHIILPALVLAARPIAQITRMTFVSVGDVLGADFVRTARSKGLWSRQVWGRHVLRNAAIPILTTVGLSLRFSLSSLPVVEYFFGWPGLGYALLKSISRQDDNLTVALILVLGLLSIVINLILELSYRALDPRLRTRADRKGARERKSLQAAIQEMGGNLRDWWHYNPVTQWLRQRPGKPTSRGETEGAGGRSSAANSQTKGSRQAESPFRALLADRGLPREVSEGEYQAERRRSWWRGTLGNLPFVLGFVIVAVLLVAVFLGPTLAPHNPYTIQGLQIIDGQFLMPPFEPGEAYPWGTDVLGRDVMSLILAGAQQTLLLAGLVVAARLVVGFVLGALAGWLNGGWLDRSILALSEIIAAFPTLLLAMTLILALGIRQGMRTFIIALCFVGWGEIMQYVRSEVMAVRPKLFIESAVAVGLRSSRIIFSQVLPILLAALISIAALEMGAVLMLLGELGFVGIFIGGGAFAELPGGGLLYQYSDVPEWGSLLSSVRTYARSYPWMAIYPALAFFVAILGFNLLGEGLRRMVETVGIGLSRLFNRYTFAAALVALLIFSWARGNTGAAAFHRQQARQVNGQEAYAVAEVLTQPEMEGRSLGTQGMADAADWIATQFESLGLQGGGEEGSYFQHRTREFSVFSQEPALSINDGKAPLTYREDFSEYPGYYAGIGEAAGPVHLVMAGELSQPQFGRSYPAFDEATTEEEIVLVITDRDALYARWAPHAGMLAVPSSEPTEGGSPDTLQQRFTPAGRNRVFRNPITDSMQGEEIPQLRISQATADRLLSGTGHSVASLRRQVPALGTDEIFELWLEPTVSMAVTSTLVTGHPARNVIGYLPGGTGRAGVSDVGFDQAMPGTARLDARGGEAQLDDELVVVLAQYDSPPPGPEGIWPAANDNASGVAVMLEVLRAFQESGYEPYRSFLFIAYAGEGLDGGELIDPAEVSKFIQARPSFSTVFKVEAIVQLRGLGNGTGNGIEVAAGGNQRLASLFETAARRSGVSASRAEEEVDLSIVFDERLRAEGGGQPAPYVTMTWEGYEATARTDEDTLETLSPQKLEQAGRAVALALMTLGREQIY